MAAAILAVSGTWLAGDPKNRLRQMNLPQPVLMFCALFPKAFRNRLDLLQCCIRPE